VEWMRLHLGDQMDITDMARHALMSTRTFARRFRDEIGMPPHQWLTRQRVARAQELLETTDASIDHIAHASGFATAVTLRHHFQRETMTTPSDYRAAFRS
jgi:transcriptional regulator GlxA family with amidase domain